MRLLMKQNDRVCPYCISIGPLCDDCNNLSNFTIDVPSVLRSWASQEQNLAEKIQKKQQLANAIYRKIMES